MSNQLYKEILEFKIECIKEQLEYCFENLTKITQDSTTSTETMLSNLACIKDGVDYIGSMTKLKKQDYKYPLRLKHPLTKQLRSKEESKLINDAKLETIREYLAKRKLNSKVSVSKKIDSCLKKNRNSGGGGCCLFKENGNHDKCWNSHNVSCPFKRLK